MLISALKQLNDADFDSEEISSVARRVTPYEASKRFDQKLVIILPEIYILLITVIVKIIFLFKK